MAGHPRHHRRLNSWRAPTLRVGLLCAVLVAAAVAQSPLAQADAPSGENWTVTSVRPLPATQIARRLPGDPYDLLLSRTVAAGGGLVWAERFGVGTELAPIDSATGLAIWNGAAYVADPDSDVIWRVPLNTTGGLAAAAPLPWVAGLFPGNDQLGGLYVGGPAQQQRGWHVHPGPPGKASVWQWSPTSAGGAIPRWWGAAVGLTKPVDVTYGREWVWVADVGAGGRLWRGAALGSSALLGPVTPAPANPVAVAMHPTEPELWVLNAQSGSLLALRFGTLLPPAHEVVVGVAPPTMLVADSVTTVLEGIPLSPERWSGLSWSSFGDQLSVTTTTGIWTLTRCGAPLDAQDCDGDGVHDACPADGQPAADCNDDGRLDSCDIETSPAKDCDADGWLDSCVQCQALDVVVLLDTSLSLADESVAVCDAVEAVEAFALARGISLRLAIWGIGSLPGGAWSCAGGTVAEEVGDTLVDFPPPFGLGPLGDCPGGGQLKDEDWGRAVAVTAGAYPWIEGATAVIVPIVDEGAYCGDPVNLLDLVAAKWAVDVAVNVGVRVMPWVGDGAGATAVQMAKWVAEQTGGFVTMMADGEWTPPPGSGAAIAELYTLAAIQAALDGVALACDAPPDCDADGVIDACELSTASDFDCNGDQVPDSCQLSASADVDGDGALDICAPPPQPGCAASCCRVDLPGCSDPHVRSCACAQDASCCSSSWGLRCTWLAKALCGLPCPSPPACTSVPKAKPGCGAGPCEACVCFWRPACCSGSWSTDCVDLALDECALECDAEQPLPCASAAGDINGDGEVNVADSQCLLLVIFSSLSGGTPAPPPSCLAQVPLTADLGCDCQVTVTDLVLSMLYVFGVTLDPTLDGDANHCPDACQP